MSIQTSVRYLSQGGEASWWVPFPYADGAQVGVTLVDTAGLERRLVYGVDYLVKDGFVICVVPPGSSLVIWLDAPLAESLEAARSGSTAALTASNAAGVASGYAAQASLAATASGYSNQANTASLASEGYAAEAAVSGVEGAVDKVCSAAVAQASEEIQDVATGAQARIDEAVDAAVARATLEAGLYGSAVAKHGYTRLEMSLAAGALLALPEGLGYFFGRGALLVWRNGLMLTQGLDWGEVSASAGEASTVIRLHQAASAGDLFYFVVMPTTSAHVAEVSAREAESAYSMAAQCQTNSEGIAAMAGKAACEAQTYAGDARGCLEDCGDMSRQAQEMAKRAWEALWHISVYQRRPGISAVRAVSEICCAAPGLFIVNPHLTHAPTPFMGVWPAKCENDMKWDGIFFIGESWPDVITPPPTPCFIRPPRPKPATGDSNDWLPCHHTHPQLDKCACCNKRDTCPAFNGSEEDSTNV